MSLTSPLGRGAITVRDVVGLEVIQRGSPLVCAGGDHLDQPVRWVHISDLPTPAPSLRGRELLLTHGVGLRHSRETQRQFIEDLAEVPVAGVILELGRTFDEVPDVMVEAASRCGVPLIALRRRILFVEVTEQVHGMILERHESRVAEAQRLGKELIDLAAAGGTIGLLLQRLSSGIGAAVVLEDAAHQLVESVGFETDSEDPIAQWSLHSRLAHPDGGDEPVPDSARSGWCCTAAVTLRNQVWGRVHALDVEPPVRSAASVAVQHAASALTIGLLYNTTLIGVGRYASGSFVHDLLARRLSRSQSLAKAHQLGVDLSASVAGVAVEVLEAGEDEIAGARARLEQVCALIEQALRPAGVGCIWWADERRGLLCLAARAGEEINTGVTAATAQLAGAGILDSANGICVGVSEVTTVEHLADALDHAREVAGLGGSPGQTTLRWYEKLGLDRLFLRAAEGPELAAYVEAELGRLLAHDAEHRSQLLPVLKAYIDVGGSKSEAARALYVGRRSLYYKLDLIGRLLDRDLDDPDDRTALAVALRGLAVLRTRGSRVRLAEARPNESRFS
jgi:purine catabolism regulator